MDFDGAGHKLALGCRDGMVLVVDLLSSTHESEPQATVWHACTAAETGVA